MRARAAASPPAFRWSVHGRKVAGSILAAVRDDVVFDLLALTERVQTGSFDGGDVDEHVLPAAIGLNEAVTFLRIEPFHSAGCQVGLPFVVNGSAPAIRQ